MVYIKNSFNSLRSPQIVAIRGYDRMVHSELLHSWTGNLARPNDGNSISID